MKKLRILILLSVLPLICVAQGNWEQKKNENGISVYTRKLNNEIYKEIKVLCQFNASAAQLIKILQNVNHHKDWVYNTKTSYLISRKNKDTLYYYSETALPWPINNRDLVIQLTFAEDVANKVLKIQALSMPKMLPDKPNVVRVPYSLGLWNVITLPNNQLKIEYTFSVNPGGTLPAWLVNFTATAGPYSTFKKLKELLESKRN